MRSARHQWMLQQSRVSRRLLNMYRHRMLNTMTKTVSFTAAVRAKTRITQGKQMIRDTVGCAVGYAQAHLRAVYDRRMTSWQGRRLEVQTCSKMSILESQIRVASQHQNFSRLDKNVTSKCHNSFSNVALMLQVAQLSQRDRAAGWVSYGQKWKTGTGRQYLRTI